MIIQLCQSYHVYIYMFDFIFYHLANRLFKMWKFVRSEKWWRYIKNTKRDALRRLRF